MTNCVHTLRRRVWRPWWGFGVIIKSEVHCGACNLQHRAWWF